LIEAARIECGSKLRNLFVVILILIHCLPTNALELWNQHKMALSEDILYKIQYKQNDYSLEYNEHVYNESLIDIEEKLSLFSKHLKDFQLPDICYDDYTNDLPRELYAELNYNRDKCSDLVNMNVI